MSIRSAVLEQIRQVAAQQHRPLQSLDDDRRLFGSGLDSLCIAIVVARLEEELELDPFSGSDAAFPVTIGDFIAAYERVAA